jgi:hypothetical protein
MSTQVVIYERNGWRLTSYGRGAAYLLEDTARSRSVFFQYGDDAGCFHDSIYGADGWLIDNVEDIFGCYTEVMQ